MRHFFKYFFSKKRIKYSDPEELTRLRDEIEETLKKELDSWYPASIDQTHGGFYTDLNYQYKATGLQKKKVIHQARHLWTISRAYRRYPSNTVYQTYADHGFHFISEKLWNGNNGGFYTEVDRKGDQKSTNIPISAYSQSFAMYSLVAYHRISHKPEALRLAIDSFHWLEDFMYDKEYKGYFSYIDHHGKIVERPGVGASTDGKCYKGVNSMLHLLEAYTELYKTWPDPLLHSRLAELLDIILSKMIQSPGYLHNYYDRKWTPVRIKKRSRSNVKKFSYLEHVSFGHDAEAAYLIWEASKVLNFKVSKDALNKTKKLIDHVLTYGIDKRKGGVFSKGYYFDNRRKLVLIDKSKIWWVQAETLYTLLLFSSLFPDDECNYFEKFIEEFAYIKKYFIDYENGGWFREGLDRSSKQKMSSKSDEWKATYHTYRALENCVDLLDEMLKVPLENR